MNRYPARHSSCDPCLALQHPQAAKSCSRSADEVGDPCKTLGLPLTSSIPKPSYHHPPWEACDKHRHLGPAPPSLPWWVSRGPASSALTSALGHCQGLWGWELSWAPSRNLPLSPDCTLPSLPGSGLLYAAGMQDRITGVMNTHLRLFPAQTWAGFCSPHKEPKRREPALHLFRGLGWPPSQRRVGCLLQPSYVQALGTNGLWASSMTTPLSCHHSATCPLCKVLRVGVSMATEPGLCAAFLTLFSGHLGSESEGEVCGTYSARAQRLPKCPRAPLTGLQAATVSLTLAGWETPGIGAIVTPWHCPPRP